MSDNESDDESPPVTGGTVESALTRIYPCKYKCGFSGSPQQLAAHYRKEHKVPPVTGRPSSQEQVRTQEGGISAVDTGLGEPELEPRQLVAQYGRDGLNQIKKERLNKVLALAPGVGVKSIPYILHRWDVNARLRDDPMALYNMLHQEGGLRPNTAYSVTADVFSVEEEFADLLRERGERPIFFGDRMGGGLPQGGGFGGGTSFGGGQPSGYGWPNAQPTGFGSPFMTRDEFYRMERDREERSRIDALNERINKVSQDVNASISKIVESFEKKIESLPDRLLPQAQYQEVTEYLDEEGNPTTPEKAKSVVTRKVPVAAGESSEVRLLREEVKGLQKSLQNTAIDQLKNELNQIRASISTRPQESPEVTSLKNELADAKKMVTDLGNEMKAKERQDLLDKIGSLENRIANLSPGEWKSDEMKLISTGISQLNQTIRDVAAQKPIREIAREILPSGTQTPPPAGGTAGETERGGVIEALRGHGLVTRITQRIRGQ